MIDFQLTDDEKSLVIEKFIQYIHEIDNSDDSTFEVTISNWTIRSFKNPDFSDEPFTDRQKKDAIKEVTHYLVMDCYDFGLSIGKLEVVAGELAELDMDEVYAELDEEF